MGKSTFFTVIRSPSSRGRRHATWCHAFVRDEGKPLKGKSTSSERQFRTSSQLLTAHPQLLQSPLLQSSMLHPVQLCQFSAIKPDMTSTPTISASALGYKRAGKPLINILNSHKWRYVQSDPDLVTSSGERVLGTKSGWPLNRGQIPLISYIGGNLSCH
eukprot:sb/3472983/